MNERAVAFHHFYSCKATTKLYVFSAFPWLQIETMSLLKFKNCTLIICLKYFGVLIVVLILRIVRPTRFLFSGVWNLHIVSHCVTFKSPQCLGLASLLNVKTCERHQHPAGCGCWVISTVWRLWDHRRWHSSAIFNERVGTIFTAPAKTCNNFMLYISHTRSLYRRLLTAMQAENGTKDLKRSPYQMSVGIKLGLRTGWYGQFMVTHHS